MNYGHFSADGREYIITNVRTPSPWINYLQNGRYFATISNNGGGISYYKSPLHGRISRYRINDVPHDRPGKYIYVKDNETTEFWSLTWQPVNKYLEHYKVTHGLGYTRVDSVIQNIETSLLFFVPLQDDLEIWHARIKNQGKKLRKLSFYSYVEFALGHGHIDIINQCDDQHFNRVHFDKNSNALYATKTYWVTENSGTQQQENKEWDQWAFMSVNLPVSGYETKREEFIGLYRNENVPEALERDQLTSRDSDFGNAVGVLKTDLELKPGEEIDLIFTLGVIPKSDFSKKTEYVNKYKTASDVNRAFADLRNTWEKILSPARIHTPDQSVNTFMNYWMPYQARTAFDVGRVVSFYYWGISRGFGFRDTSQDTIAVTLSNPEKARDRICMLSRQMFTSGRVYHHFYADGQGETTGHCDDPLWYILAVTDYIKETGDTDILYHREPFIDSKEGGSVMEHLMAIVNFVKNNLGRHGLPIFGRGDWNDTLDYIGGDDGGESVWGGMFYVAMLNLLIELLDHVHAGDLKNQVTPVRDEIQSNLDKFCWDGEWYIRAFGQNDRKIGSHSNTAGKIFLNTQIWAVIAQLPDTNRLRKAMDSVERELVCAYGPKICAPAYKEIDPTIGLVTRCVAGKKENAAVFCHPTTWLIQAECLMGNGNRAFKYYKSLLPNTVDSDTFVAEPYVYSQYITSDEHELSGRASHSWQTGTGAWMYRVSIDYILGIRSSYKGLIVDPAIPSHWDGFTFERIFRGKKYKIKVENPEHVEHGVKKICVNGAELSGNILPVCESEEFEVEVILGKF